MRSKILPNLTSRDRFEKVIEALVVLSRLKFAHSVTNPTVFNSCKFIFDINIKQAYLHTLISDKG